MILSDDKKDWEIARDIFGKNTKTECNLIKRLRKKKYTLTLLCEGYYLLEQVESDEVGWIVPESCVKI